jgi:hypothetical protein
MLTQPCLTAEDGGAQALVADGNEVILAAASIGALLCLETEAVLAIVLHVEVD